MSINCNKTIARQLGFALWEERRKRGFRLASMQRQTGLSEKTIDRIELGKGITPTAIHKLLEFYKKNIKVELID